jgi:hypothetical protein
VTSKTINTNKPIDPTDTDRQDDLLDAFDSGNTAEYFDFEKANINDNQDIPEIDFSNSISNPYTKQHKKYKD